ncbi:DUF1613-domain-containing protein [Dentipellis sp. KUC8613]|nr:DUF1613-domain-containing protein [Dentipellis sp. KUC8613]
MSAPTKPRFTPTPCVGPLAHGPCPEVPSNDGKEWQPIISCPADFPAELFETATSQLIHHPEYNSTLILRSEVVSDTTEDFPPSIPIFEGLVPVRNIHRKLLARRPTRDASLEQHCTLYAPSPSADHTPTHPTMLVLTPILAPDGSLPYYHPTVSHLAFRYISAPEPSDSSAAALQIAAVPLPNTPLDINARLYRTCLALLETLHRYGWGALTQYKKRVHHDCLVPRAAYQDLYLVMRERHKHLVDTWQEVTDPLKHVFEDIGIATFLMLLWKDTYGPASTEKKIETEPNSPPPSEEPLNEAPWKHWPRPPGGFVDLGCGNGLLTHILVSEGYAGHGFDLRARTSWAHYAAPTRAALHVSAFDPTSLPTAPTSLPTSSPISSALSGPVDEEHPPHLPPGAFLIGNHADELTPWLPVLATLARAAGYLSIPCCPWAFDARFDRSRDAPFVDPALLAEEMQLGGGGGGGASAYAMYRVWLASLSVRCGWVVECETLRIPSTRNWAIVGRKHAESEAWEEAEEHAREIVRDVKRRGVFKTRTPEGKAGEH